jgi:hypothetical protein
VVEVGDLLAQVVVLEEDGPARTGLERVVGVVQTVALRGGEALALLRDGRLAVTRGGTGGAHGPRAALVGFGRQGSPHLGGLGEAR